MRDYYLQFLLLLLGVVLSCTAIEIGFSFDLHHSKFRCIDKERQALLQFKQHLVDPSHWLSSWDVNDEDCCNWEGIQCNNRTGHVVTLNLQGNFVYGVPITKYVEGEISSSLLGLQYLTYLDLSSNNFSGKFFPNFVGSFNKLEYLNLSYTQIVGIIPQQLGNLSRLVSLDLSKNYGMTEAHNLDWLIHLSSLTHLDMSGVNLSQVLNWPNTVMMLPSLIYLSLSDCSLISIKTPHLLSINTNSSSKLRFLDLSANYLNCSIFSWLLTSTTNLVHLYLPFCGLQCSIPDAFGIMNSLRFLDLSGNQLVGGIPKSFGNLCTLNSLYLNYNKLNGDLYGFMSNASSCVVNSLQNFQIHNNRFIGQLPESIGNFSNLKALELSENNFTGPLPESIGNLSNLQMLDVSRNSLAGVISDAHFSNLFNLKELYFDSNPLTMRFSYDWVPPFQLDFIFLSSCRLGSTFPKWLQSQRNYRMLDISNAGISDIIPTWFWEFPPKLLCLYMSNNQLRGNLPDLSSSRLDFLIIDLSSNLLDGSIPPFPSNVTSLNLSNNSFTGNISILCKLTYKSLMVLDLSYNKLSGKLPDCWMRMQDLRVLNLANNNFYGNIPTSMGSLVSLRFLHLSKNSFAGNLPLSLQNCSNLETIDVSENKFSGMVPSWIGDSLPWLIILSLRSNGFYGSLPLNLCHLTNIQFLDLSLNKIKGIIPDCINNLTSMSQKQRISDIQIYAYYSFYLDHAPFIWKGRETIFKKSLGLVKIIDFSSNKLHGEVPEGFTSLTELVSLNLSRNNLSGSITLNIGQLQNLQALDLSRNKLCGEIPTSISDISFLSYLDLSNNNLWGKIPTGTQLQTLNASAFMGNVRLCGSPLPNKCPGDLYPVYNNTRGRRNMDNQTDDDDGLITHGFYVAAALGFTVGFWGVCCTLLLNLQYIMMHLSSNTGRMLR